MFPFLAAPAGTHLVTPQVQGGVGFPVLGIGGAVPSGTPTDWRRLGWAGALSLGLVARSVPTLPKTLWGFGKP